MTDASTTGAVERLAPYAVDGGCDAYGQMESDPFGDYVSYEAYQALVAERDAAIKRAEAAERRAYDLAVAIMGGEDAPGYADSIPTQALIDQQREMVCEWMGAVPHTVARTQAAAAWIAGRDAVLGDGNHWDGDILKLPEAHRLTPPADLSAALTARLDAEWNAGRDAAADVVESMWAFRTCREVTDAIRALRRAAPTEGEA